MILVLIVMTGISFSFRYAPFVLSNWLQRWTFLGKLASTLPICILILFVAHNLEHTSCGIPELAGVAAVIVAQALSRSILFSMAIGVFCHQLLMRM